MSVFEIDPHRDPRWKSLVDSHPESSVFHTLEWLGALNRTYGYTSRVFTTCRADQELTDGLPCCQVKSRLTGKRLVSLPFSDHCEPLVPDVDTLRTLLSGIGDRYSDTTRYVEIRSGSAEAGGSGKYLEHARYCLHSLDLSIGAEALYAALHASSIRRKVRRAERDGVDLEEGRSEAMLRAFYDLQVLTRRRHHVPPQPMAWFRNLSEAFGDRLTIRVARFKGTPIASILTLSHKTTVVYKYGCSDERFHNLGGMPYLFWSTIESAAAGGFARLDLGRSELENPGLIQFKDRLGASRSTLTYFRLSKEGRSRAARLIPRDYPGRLIACLPSPIFRLCGEILYRHAG
jgi:CelD/BcsL family acetyltransferase involved in cellulose biosynthesis